MQPLTETSTAAATDGHGLERLLQRGARVIYLPPAASAARYAPLVLDWGREMKVRVVSGYPGRAPTKGRSCGWPWITAAWGRTSATWPNGS